MPRAQRFGLIVLAIAVAAVAFVLARPDDTEEKAGAPAGEGEPASTADAPTATTDTRPEIRIVMRGHEPTGGVRRIEVRKGDLVRLVVESDARDELHLHGYDITREAAPGVPARFSFRAEIEGDFELESHEGGETAVARILVEPA